MRRFSMIEAPVLALYSKSFYRDVADHWHYATPIFLLIVLLLSWVPSMFGVYANWSKFMKTQVPPLLEQMPAISISEGVVTAEPPGPTYVTDRSTGKVWVIIDTTGTVTSLQQDGAQMLLTRTQFIARKSAGETRIYDLSRVKDFSIDRHRLQRWLELAAIWAPPGLFVFLVFLSAIYRFLQALVYGAVGLWFAKRGNIPIRYGAAVRIAMMSLYPTIVLKTALQAAGLTSRLYGLIFLVIALSYVWFGVQACRSEGTAVPMRDPRHLPPISPAP